MTYRIQRPLLAAHPNLDEIDSILDSLTYPVIVSPKVDGFRVYRSCGAIKMRSGKPVPNAWLSDRLYEQMPDNVDGELVAGNTFSETQGSVKCDYRECEWKLYLFDGLGESPYRQRIQDVWNERLRHSENNVEVLPHWYVYSKEHLLHYESLELQRPYPFGEGLMIRTPDGVYKQGRSTIKEQILIALKRREFDEATIYDYEQQQVHIGESTTNALGLEERDSRAENRRPIEALGALVVRSRSFERDFKIGTGFTQQQRESLWLHRETLLGKRIRYEYQPVGTKDRPRQPSFKEFLP